ncbi:MAG: hypothetical protein U1E00_08840 [Pseudoxanthomonas sp.]|nr:hypothetical protein [Pseudoxanthomonas sp.]
MLISTLAVAVIVLAAAYLVGLGICALAAPALARRFLLGFVGTVRLHYLELALRVLVGVALVVRGPQMLWPQAAMGLGWLLVLTTTGLALVPWHWHQKFAQRSVPAALRFLPLLGASSLVLGGGLLYALYSPS